MANILPSEAEKRTRREYRARFMLIGSLVVLLCALCVMLSFVPAEIALATTAAAQNAATQNPSANLAGNLAAVKGSQALLNVLVSEATSTEALAAITAALSARQSGVTLDTVSFSAGTHAITLDGHAKTPDEVNAYRTALEADPHFTNVSVPVGSLLGEEDGGFTMTLSGHF